MHVLITGANGFIGRHLVKKLISESSDLAINHLTAIDLNLDLLPDHPLIHKVCGSFSDSTALNMALDDYPVDQVFHLASVPSGRAEIDFSLGVQVNITGTMDLLEKLKAQTNTAAMVFASSIAVYGKPSGDEVNDDTLPNPNLSYGVQKVIGETLVADYHRRNWIRGCSVRIPGVVARPPEPNGAVSIFFSDLIRNLSQGNAFTCPVSATAMSWLMSVDCCVENLLLAATIKSDSIRTWTLPALHVSIEEIVQQIAILFPHHDVQALISYEADPWVEENFGSYPPIHCSKAEEAGFHHDGSLENLVVNALKCAD